MKPTTALLFAACVCLSSAASADRSYSERHLRVQALDKNHPPAFVDDYPEEPVELAINAMQRGEGDFVSADGKTFIPGHKEEVDTNLEEMDAIPEAIPEANPEEVGVNPEEAGAHTERRLRA